MSDQHVIAAQVRDRAGKGAARAARRAGMVPAVIYGAEKDPTHVVIERRQLQAEIAKGGFTSRLLDITLGGGKEHVLPREIHFHAVTDVPMHVDFLRVTDSTLINVNVPVVFEGEEECPGLKLGGVLNIVRHEVELKCRAGAIPETLTAKLAGLDIGDSLRISAIELPGGARPVITDRDFTIATIAAPTVQVEVAETVEAEGDEAAGDDKEANEEDGKG
ncbi:MAG: 50S ribosomal protein L25/general stress protein Ctc [Alphaproteobacteria bacterium]|jgi:large subunit ribosomal protein L25